MIKKIRKIKKVNSQKGFTLLEILVVLTIMGFLIAMVAPRLAGIGNDAVDTICDTNQNRMVTYLSAYFQQTDGSLPDNLTNLVAVDGTASQKVAVISNGDPDDGMGVLSNEFAVRNNFKAHMLNAAEAAELAGLGIVNVFNLNDPKDTSDHGPFMDPNVLGSGDVVAMVGMGAADDAASTKLSIATTNNVEDVTGGVDVEEYGWGEHVWLGRIVFGLGPECGLITTGIISNAAHCPGGLQNADNATYNDYNIVVPRLSATVDRLPTNIFGASATNNVTTAVAYMEGDLDLSTSAYALAGNTENFMKRDVTLLAQEGWEFQTQCPEGHVYPQTFDCWAIDMDGNGSINQ